MSLWLSPLGGRRSSTAQLYQFPRVNTGLPVLLLMGDTRPKPLWLKGRFARSKGGLFIPSTPCMEPYVVSDERIATLEAQREGDQATLIRMAEQLDTVADDVQAIKMQMEKQKGFLAGMMFILLPIWSAITAAAIALWDKWTDVGP
jgi:hypothetical protein